MLNTTKRPDKTGLFNSPPERILTRIYKKRRPEERLLVTPTGFKPVTF